MPIINHVMPVYYWLVTIHLKPHTKMPKILTSSADLHSFVITLRHNKLIITFNGGNRLDTFITTGKAT